jgi:outer membrane protein TolC
MTRSWRTMGAAMALLLAGLPAQALAHTPEGLATEAVQTAPQDAPGVTLAEAQALAEAHNPGLRLARYQMDSARAALTAAPANATALAPLASLYARTQLGLTIPEDAISPVAAGRQAQISYEQAVVQYYQARQQVRLGALQAYVEWQRASALVAAQQGALERAISQEAQVQVAVDVGSAAHFDLLQAQAQLAGQKAALTGAGALQASARQALEQAIGLPLVADVKPSQELLRSADVTLTADLPSLMAKALINRPDLRDARLNIEARRLQTGLATNAASIQVQAASVQYEMDVAKARTEVQQALAQAQSALEELRARESALEPATEALRLAELRYGAGLTTYLEVQSALAAQLQAEAARIQAAANLTLGLARLAQATGDL